MNVGAEGALSPKDLVSSKERGCKRGTMRLYTPYAEADMTRVMGSERWHHNPPTNLVSMHKALKDAL